MSKNLTTAFHSETTKPENSIDETRTIKKAKNYAHTYNFEILNYFNPELHLKNTEFLIKNKQKNCLVN